MAKADYDQFAGLARLAEAAATIDQRAAVILKWVLYQSQAEHNEDCARYPFEEIPCRVFLEMGKAAVAELERLKTLPAIAETMSNGEGSWSRE